MSHAQVDRLALEAGLAIAVFGRDAHGLEVCLPQREQVLARHPRLHEVLYVFRKVKLDEKLCWLQSLEVIALGSLRVERIDEPAPEVEFEDETEDGSAE